MKYYNIETRNEAVFYRLTDWGVNDIRGNLTGDPNFTTDEPPEDTLKYGVPCDFIDSGWVLDVDSTQYKNLYSFKRALEYPTCSELIVALWEKVIENRPETADELQTKRQAVKNKHKKPC